MKWFKLPHPEVLYSTELDELFIFDSFRIYKNQLQLNLICGQGKIRLFLATGDDILKIGEL